jgi:required for meiotic nuclear division protein 1
VIKEQENTLSGYGVSKTVALPTVWKIFRSKNPRRFGYDCIGIPFSENKIFFVYSYGSVVFVNFPESEHLKILSLLGLLDNSTKSAPLNEDFTEDDVIIEIVPDTFRIEFSKIILPLWNIEHVQLVSMLLAKSSALEHVERSVENILSNSEEISKNLIIPLWSKSTRPKIISSLSLMLQTRHHIVNRLSLLSDPEITWENENSYKIYRELSEYFDIMVRVERIEKMLQVASDAAELQLDFINIRRAEILEIIIIVLIVLEILRTLI